MRKVSYGWKQGQSGHAEKSEDDWKQCILWLQSGQESQSDIDGIDEDWKLRFPGVYIPIEVGKATITVTTEDGNQTATCVVEVTQGGTDGQITWAIDGDGKLTVDGTGNLSSIPWRPYAEQITSAEITVKGMTDATSLFEDCSNMKSVNLKKFDTSRIKSMRRMFAGCECLMELDVSGFDTSQVTDMSLMFGYCLSLTELNVSKFNTGKVTSMNGMFSDCWSLQNLDVSGFDTGQVTDMNSMFYGCSLTELDISNFDVGQVTDMEDLFDCSPSTVSG